MDLEVGSVIGAAPHGVLTMSAAAQAGLHRRDLARLVERGRLVRLTAGAYLQREVWDGLSQVQRHSRVAVALALISPGDLALSHTSAAAFHGLPFHHGPGRRLHLTRLDPGLGRTRSGFTVHRGFGPALASVAVLPGVPAVATPAMAALGVARVQGFTAGVVALDGALHAEMATRPECERLLASMRRWPGSAELVRVLAAADARAESAIETLARLLLRSLGLTPIPQVTLRTADGAFVARVDFLLEELGVVVEVDGRVKYVAADGTGSVTAVVNEKRRESAITDLGYVMVRLDAPMLDDRERVRRLLLAGAARSRRAPAS